MKAAGNLYIDPRTVEMLKAWNYIVPKEMVRLTVRQLKMGSGASVESEAVKNVIEVSVDIDFSSIPVRTSKGHQG